MNKFLEGLNKTLDVIYEWYERDVMDNPTSKILIGFVIGSILLHVFL